MKVALCICTFRRPEGLRKALARVEKLDFDGELLVCVADNDAAGEGLAVCESLQENYRWPLYSTGVEESGISFSRNASSDLALSHSPDFVGFLDDDEWPEPDWLEQLLRVQSENDADAVGGPTISVFPENTPAAQQRNEYYGADLGVPDGAVCQLEAAGNFLIRASTLIEMGPEFFHPAFAKSGGEDLAFFMKMKQHGAKMHWAANAKMNEAVPSDRLSPEWLKKRVIVIANSRVRVMRMLQPGLPATLVRCAKTCALFTQAMILTVAGVMSPTLAEKACILRWKFWGKFTAHIKLDITRAEGR